MLCFPSPSSIENQKWIKKLRVFVWADFYAPVFPGNKLWAGKQVPVFYHLSLGTHTRPCWHALDDGDVGTVAATGICSWQLTWTFRWVNLFSSFHFFDQLVQVLITFSARKADSILVVLAFLPFWKHAVIVAFVGRFGECRHVGGQWSRQFWSHPSRDRVHVSKLRTAQQRVSRAMFGKERSCSSPLTTILLRTDTCRKTSRKSITWTWTRPRWAKMSWLFIISICTISIGTDFWTVSSFWCPWIICSTIRTRPRKSRKSENNCQPTIRKTRTLITKCWTNKSSGTKSSKKIPVRLLSSNPPPAAC